MVTRIQSLSAKVVVADTMVPQALETLHVRRVLILREMPHDRIGQMYLREMAWDVLVVPNTPDHWMPSADPLFASHVLPVGWIYRSPAPFACQNRGAPRLLVATGGGGNTETARSVAAVISEIVAMLRTRAAFDIDIVQAMGPRASEEAVVYGISRQIDPGGDLHERFAQADAVISTSGYNSVLEIALTTTPAVLVAIDRSLDDQIARARAWGPRVGMAHHPEDPQASAVWLHDVLKQRSRRPAADIGPSGATRAAAAILELCDL